jgi:hypothetical protein
VEGELLKELEALGSRQRLIPVDTVRDDRQAPFAHSRE